MKLHRILGRLLPALVALALALPAGAEESSRSQAPNFALRTVDGERVKLSDYEGKVVLLSFWATWCAPCKQELPVLQALLERHGDKGLAVLAVNIDDPKTIADVRRFVADRKLSMPVPLDKDSKVLGKFNPKHALPFLQLIDRKGRRVSHHTGFSAGAEVALEKEVVALLAEGQQQPETAAAP